MSTTLARSRASRAANSVGVFDEPPAARKTRSAPRSARRLQDRPLDELDPAVVGPGASQGTGLFGQPAPLGHHVDADDLHAGRHQQPHDQLSHQTESDDAGDVADLDVTLSDTLQRDGSDGGERGMLGCHRVGNRDAQVRRNPVALGVKGELVAGAGDELARGRSRSPLHPPRRRSRRSEYPSGVSESRRPIAFLYAVTGPCCWAMSRTASPGPGAHGPCRSATSWTRPPSSSRCRSISARTASARARRQEHISASARRARPSSPER